MKIIQKTIYQNYLTIGINVFWLLLMLSCKTIIEPAQTINFVYKNVSGIPVELTVFNERHHVDFPPTIEEYSFTIANDDSIHISMTGTPYAAPFYTEIENDPVGDSVVLEFNGNKCTTYTRNIGNGVFRYPEYEEYTNDFFKVSEVYLLTYIIDIVDHGRASDCN